MSWSPRAPKNGLTDAAIDLPQVASNFCSAEEEREVETFFRPRGERWWLG